MNRFEFWLVNNPIRSFLQKTIEMKRIRQYSPQRSFDNILEIGCGQGDGSKLIEKYFTPTVLHAIDLDPKMIARAKKRNKNSEIIFAVGDATKLEFPDEIFQAIFDFGVIHHIPNWQDCLQELYRVLKPGGSLVLEDLSLESFESTILGKVTKKLTDHPYAQMFRKQEFYDFLEKIGFQITVKKEYSFGFFYFLIIAQK